MLIKCRVIQKPLPAWSDPRVYPRSAVKLGEIWIKGKRKGAHSN